MSTGSISTSCSSVSEKTSVGQSAPSARGVPSRTSAGSTHGQSGGDWCRRPPDERRFIGLDDLPGPRIHPPERATIDSLLDARAEELITLLSDHVRVPPSSSHGTNLPQGTAATRKG